jgi:hypothetical protein
VGLARRVQDHGGALGQRRGHHRVLGGGDARLVEEDLRAAEPALEGQAQRGAGIDAGAERAESQQVGVHPATADAIAARGGERGPARPGQQTRSEQHRAAQLRHHRGVGIAALELARVQAHRPALFEGDLHAQVTQPLQQHGDVADARNVVDDHLGPREHAGREHGQGLVLVARGRDRAPQGMAALHQEPVAGHGSVLNAVPSYPTRFFAPPRERARADRPPGRAGAAPAVYHLPA